MKRFAEALAVIAATSVLAWSGIARAEPVQQFTFEVAGPGPAGLTVHLHLRRFDTTGAVPPTPTAFELRLPAGVRLNPALLTPRYRCDGVALRDALDARPSRTPFNARLKRLDAFARELARSGAKRDRAALANVRACARARLGDGSGMVDAREAVGVLTDPIPFAFSMFLSAGTVPGAVAGLTAIGAPDPRSAVARRYPVVAGVHAVERESFLLVGQQRLVLALNTGPINGFQVSRAEIDATVRTLTIRRGTCLARGRSGRCARRQRADASLFTLPSCPASGRFGVELFAAYPPPTPSQTTTVEVPCPRYVS